MDLKPWATLTDPLAFFGLLLLLGCLLRGMLMGAATAAFLVLGLKKSKWVWTLTPVFGLGWSVFFFVWLRSSPLGFSY